MPGKIVIIEDNEANLELMTYLLEAFGHAPLTARDGESGLELVRQEAPALVLCDIQLPGLNGVEVAQKLRGEALPRLRDTRLVAVTSMAMVGDRERLIASGFDECITKPIDPESFVALVEGFLANSSHKASP